MIWVDDTSARSRWAQCTRRAEGADGTPAIAVGSPPPLTATGTACRFIVGGAPAGAADPGHLACPRRPPREGPGAAAPRGVPCGMAHVSYSGQIPYMIHIYGTICNMLYRMAHSTEREPAASHEEESPNDLSWAQGRACEGR